VPLLNRHEGSKKFHKGGDRVEGKHKKMIPGGTISAQPKSEMRGTGAREAYADFSVDMLKGKEWLGE